MTGLEAESHEFSFISSDFPINDEVEDEMPTCDNSNDLILLSQSNVEPEPINQSLPDYSADGSLEKLENAISLNPTCSMGVHHEVFEERRDNVFEEEIEDFCDEIKNEDFEDEIDDFCEEEDNELYDDEKEEILEEETEEVYCEESTNDEICVEKQLYFDDENDDSRLDDQIFEGEEDDRKTSVNTVQTSISICANEVSTKSEICGDLIDSHSPEMNVQCAVIVKENDDACTSDNSNVPLLEDAVENDDLNSIVNTNLIQPEAVANSRVNKRKQASELLPETLPKFPYQSTSKIKTLKSIPTRILTADTTHVPIQPSHVLEYEWPQKSGDRFFIQEQISQLLEINSFKRKYPDLRRRTIDSAERDYLIKQLGLATLLPSTHFTALQAVEVHDLMSSEYPVIYEEYQKACAAKLKQKMMEKQKELDLIKLDGKKMEELRQKAIRSAADFNSDLQAVKKERHNFLDVQTNIIQSPANKWLRMPAEFTKLSNYPVMVIPGQYTSHYKMYTSEELRRFPFNRVLENNELFPLKRAPSPPSCRINDEELNAINNAELNDQLPITIHSIKNIKQETISTSSPSTTPVRKSSNSDIFDNTLPPKSRRTSSAKKLHQHRPLLTDASSSLTIKPKSVAKDQNECTICQKTELPPQGADINYHLTICCFSCQRYYHSSCLEYSKEMIDSVQRYPWCCLDCKTCTVCGKPDQEESMMCCDLCDRGYHTFCIGLTRPPTGIWHCISCKLACASNSAKLHKTITANS